MDRLEQIRQRLSEQDKRFEDIEWLLAEFELLFGAAENYFESHECPGEAQCSECHELAAALHRYA